MATRWYKEENGVVGEYIAEDGAIHRRLHNPNRQAILKQNAEVKRSGARMMGWGQQIADIPISDLFVLRKFFGQALFNPKHDKFERKLAREKFLKSPASDPYRLEARRIKERK